MWTCGTAPAWCSCPSDDSTAKEIFEKASALRSEYVVAATGLVRERESKTNKITTGDIEVYVSELRLLAKAETPPFEIVENSRPTICSA